MNIDLEIVYLAIIVIVFYILFFPFPTSKSRKTKSNENVYKDNSKVLCPECKHDQFYEGPSGGSFGNIECCKCGTRYNNLGPFGLQKIK